MKHKFKFNTDSEGGMFGLYFTNDIPNNIEDIKNSDINMFNKFFNFMLERGVFFAPSPYEAGFISEAHTDGDFKKVYKLFEEFIVTVN